MSGQSSHSEFVPPEFPERFNMSRYFLTQRLEEGRGGRKAILTENRSYTYAEIEAAANRAARVLQEMGVEQEDRVLVILPDGVEFAAAWFGILKAGAVFAMVNPLVPTEDFDHYFEYTRAKVAFIDASALDRLMPAMERARHLRHAIVVGGEAPSLHRVHCSRWADTVDSAPAREICVDTHREDVAGWLFTSGSTGKPKAAVHRHVDFPYNTECYAKRVLGISESDVTLAVSKLFFGYATGVNLMFPFAAGGACALFPQRSTPEEVFAQIRRHQPTILCSVPTSIAGMLALDGKSRSDLGRLRLLTSAGEALPAELYRRWFERYGIEILDGIGSAEMFHVYVSNRPGRVRLGSLGEVVPGYDARVVTSDGRDAAPDEIGHLWIRGESAALGYFQDRAKSWQVFRGEWCVSGDLFRRDSEGYFTYEGRADDLLKVSGIWVSPLEIEGCLLQHPAVKECCVVGAKDKDDLVKPRAFVVLQAGRKLDDALLAELRAHAKAKMAPYKYPRWIESMEELPRGDRGKADRKVLRARPLL